MRDDFRDHRVILRADRLADRDAGIDAYSRPARQLQHAHPPTRREKAAGRILGVYARLDGVPLRRRRQAVQPLPGGDAQLPLDEVDPVHGLGDRMLDLQTSVHLQEVVAGRLLRVGDELDRPRADVAACSRQCDALAREDGAQRPVHRR